MNGRSWKFALLGSFVLNVFLLGAIAGGAYQWFATHGVKRPAAAQQRAALRFAAEPLSAAQQRAFIEGLQNARREGRPYAREGREGRREVLRLLAEPQFDRAALDAALARTRAADSKLRAMVEASVADFAETLSPTERIEFADSLRWRGEWRGAQPAPNAKQQANAQHQANSPASVPANPAPADAASDD
ncbi:MULTISPECIES: periplasmic heavy metal sensor [Burkholderiaceae]|uniref:periplasmic heavy metal sensor n=1 Tax=Burkholderiaceae TaxID=119060 RepID=UPI001424718E|nr:MULTISPECIES: periplasmic heavy metal sensor [Burkholderiaceae]MBN3850875.1 periplasmic heavy metal sensor [Paraburkholderia sp. Ac-20342]NIF56107.1 periplasmic heavy metal sensor [Burkholderia sp. Ax-1724]